MTENRLMALLPGDMGAPADSGFTALEGDALQALLAHMRRGGKNPAPDMLSPQMHLAESMARPQAHERLIANWRGALAVALLYDCWILPADAPEMTVHQVQGADSPFAAAVTADLPAESEPLRLLMLGGVPMGLLGGPMGLTPAADPTGIEEVLPERVTWFDASQARFDDPCAVLNESDRTLLLRRLSLMEDCPALAAFREDIARAAQQQSSEADTTLALRIKAVCGFAGTEALTVVREAYLADEPARNPILASSSAEKCAPPPAQITYLWQGTPFARSSAALGLEAARHPGEWAVLSALSSEIDLMERYSVSWKQKLIAGLAGMRAEDAAAAGCIGTLREEAAQAADPAQAVVLTWPWEQDSVAVRMLLREALGEAAVTLAAGAFSDMLTVLPSCPEDALADPVMQQVCRIQFSQPTEPCGALPPLSEAAAKLVAEGTALIPDSFRMIHEQQESGEERTHASFALQGKRTVAFTRIYEMEDVCVLTAEDIPAVAVWPCVPFPKERWHAYYVLAQDVSDVEALALSEGQWCAGEHRTRGSAAWTVQQTSDYPACVALRMEGRSIGVLPNLLPPFEPAARGSAAVSLDFGVSGTAAAIRIGEEIMPAGGASLTRTLLHGTNLPSLADAVIDAPEVPPVLPSVLAVTAEGVRPLLDGFICQPHNAGESATVDLKWLSGQTRAQAWRLYLGQVMLTASLTAVLHGATDVTWRMAIPDGMAAEGRAALAECIHMMARETAALTGLPLTDGAPAASFAPESLATGAYFRLRNEVNLKGGLTTLDLGAGSATMSVWLRGQNRPAAVCTMPLGVQMMLMDCVLAEPRLLTDCLNDSVSPGLWAAASGLRSHAQQARGNMKALRRARLALEDCFSHHAPELLMQMRTAPGCTRLEALLLWRMAQVMTCCGLMLEQVYQNPSVNDLLPGVMPVAVSGRGALLMQGMDPARQARLWRMLMLPMSRNHPVRELFPLATPEPKLETVMGLAQLDGLPEFPEAAEAYIPLGMPATPPVMLVQRFVAAFAMEFPDAMEALLPGAFKPNGGFTPQLEALLMGLIGQYFPQGAGMQAQYVACLNALVQAWTPPEDYPGAGMQY